MAQLMLPMIPAGTTVISDKVSVDKRDGRWVYFLGLHPIYEHDEGDSRMFKIVTSQLINSGACRHRDIIATFGVSKSSVNRALKKYREGGIEAFFRKRKGGRRGTVLTGEKLEQAQSLLDGGMGRGQVADELEVKKDTLRKAINDGRLVEVRPTIGDDKEPGSDKTRRTAEDCRAAEAMGTACTRPVERVLASLGGQDGAETRFETCRDVSGAGVLCALPALMANGLFDGVGEILGKTKGYYTVFHILLTVAFMSLSRIKSVEKTRGRPAGEFGKILGLDRMPEAKCLREKLDAMSAEQAAEKWAAHLSYTWMSQNPDDAGTLYIDGHVRVYNGKATKLPRRYVARQRLCLRATTDYWVNDAIGRPFFLVEKPVDPGLLKTLENDIVPRLLADVPNQPGEIRLQDEPFLCRFAMVFDREGYSPAFFRRMWVTHRIACMTYHKFPKDNWPEEWFVKHKVTMPNGETISMRLAEMGSLVGSGKEAMWMKEVRKLTKSGHQTSLISTGYAMDHVRLAACMFTRWCQENFFRYMRQHYGIDMLSEYGLEDLPDTERVVNPKWRQLDRTRNRLAGQLRTRRASFTALDMHPESEDDPKKYQEWVEKKAQKLEEVEHLEKKLEDVKIEIKDVAKHVEMGELDDEDKFQKLSSGRKRLLDTIKMIAYRSETAMAAMLIKQGVDSAEARRILQDLFVSDADLIPEYEDGILRVRVHSACLPATNRTLAILFEELNETKIKYPGTEIKIVYELVK